MKHEPEPRNYAPRALPEAGGGRYEIGFLRTLKYTR